ncbi:hypothetical protein [Salinimicrobium sp. GXAS 041]|uniref:hypothetical protein n=1 Tax=Salinimicrobium sp. GXAS 041 TaxID=3400806 RepID=UPI003C75686B
MSFSRAFLEEQGFKGCRDSEHQYCQTILFFGKAFFTYTPKTAALSFMQNLIARFY